MSTYSHPRTYNHSALEAKWSAYWQKTNAFDTPKLLAHTRKRYILDMFPYPSGAGLHVGHLLGYTGSDVLARFARKQGYAVLHPMGWDAFGLPAENYALKSGIHPSISTATNIENFKQQFAKLGYSYDWSKEINTSSPEYYQWTQWLFSILYKRGLAYQKEGAVNWCPKDQTVLANEQVIQGACERCGTHVVQREMKQWYFRITEYAQELLDDLEQLEWPEKIKAMQRNWIGRSSGATLLFKVNEDALEVFTTRPDTLSGVTFLVVAPEHPLLETLVQEEQFEKVNAYVAETARISERERTFTDRPKTGAFTGSYAKNPLDGTQIPVWVADYVLASYGTGAVMGVPAHDERDYAFANQFHLNIKQAVGPENAPLPYLAKGEAEAMSQSVNQAGGRWTVTYRLRDWLVSRQRYWGVPIPIMYGSNGEMKLVEQEQLPVELPKDVDFIPTGRSPLEAADEWKHVTAANGSKWLRETDTLDTFVCSSWYYLRYPTPHLTAAAFDATAVKEWLPVDTYIGGAEHAVLHLLYSRFITKVLADEGLLSFREPFTKLVNQGMILGPDHQKMSKSKGNVISPDAVIDEVGADVLRVYELFLAPFDAEKPWDTKGISGVRRFLDRLWRLQPNLVLSASTEVEQHLMNKLILGISEHLAATRFNVAISLCMEALNRLEALPTVSKITYKTLLTLINPFAPFVTEELWELSAFEGSCMAALWPVGDSTLMQPGLVTIVIQVNGKVRGKIDVDAAGSQELVFSMALEIPSIIKAIGNGLITKQIFVPGKLLSLVVIAS